MMRGALSYIQRFTKGAKADSRASWNLLFLSDQRFAPNPAQSPAVNRGAYLGTALGHRADCDTPRNLILYPDRSTKGLDTKAYVVEAASHFVAWRR